MSPIGFETKRRLPLLLARVSGVTIPRKAASNFLFRPHRVSPVGPVGPGRVARLPPLPPEGPRLFALSGLASAVTTALPTQCPAARRTASAHGGRSRTALIPSAEISAETFLTRKSSLAEIGRFNRARAKTKCDSEAEPNPNGNLTGT